MRTIHFPSATGAILVLLMIPFFAFAGEKERRTGLDVSFRVFDGENIMNRFSLTIYCNGEMTDSIIVRKCSEYKLHLDFNNSYILRINQPGFRERLIMVDTKVTGRREKQLFEYAFDISMLSDSLPPNTLADLPTMLIHYDKKIKDFDYSDTYAKSVGHLPVTSNIPVLHIGKGRKRKYDV